MRTVPLKTILVPTARTLPVLMSTPCQTSSPMAGIPGARRYSSDTTKVRSFTLTTGLIVRLSESTSTSSAPSPSRPSQKLISV